MQERPTPDRETRPPAEGGASDALERFGLLIEHTADAVLFVGEDNLILHANPAAAETYGYGLSELIGLPLSAICPQEDDPACSFARALETGRSLTLEGVHRRRTGTPFPVEISVVAARLGGVRVVMAIIRDITERRRRASCQQILHGIDKRILRSEPIERILKFIADGLAETYHAVLVQIALKGADGSVDIRECAGEGSDFLRSIRVRWDDTPQGQGPTGTAIRTGQEQLRNLEIDPQFTPWRKEALAAGLRSALALPLIAHGDDVLGALTMFTDGIRSFDSAELEELRGFADQIALSLVSASEQEEVRLQRAALETVANAVLISAADGVIEWVNPAFTRLTGYALEEVRGKTPRVLKSGNHSEAFYREMWRSLLAGQVWQGEIYNRRKDGSLYVEEMTITPVRARGGVPGHFVAVKQEITERKKNEERLRHMALHDALTELPNRRALESALDRLARKETVPSKAAMLLIDLDDFKSVNDTLGHFAGDQVLADLASVLRSALRPGDFLARLGGDEFAVLLEETGPEEAFRVAERLRQAVDEEHFTVGDHVFDLSVSVGLAPIERATAARSIMISADSGLYAAKDLGKNRVVVVDPLRAEPTLTVSRHWEGRIREAIRDGRFVLHFQPVIHLGSGEAVHYEALVRMVGGDDRLVYPADFLAAAERFGLMSQVDLWVLGEVLDLLPAVGGTRIFVNLSGTSLSDETLLLAIEERIRAACIPPGQLAFEITESTAITDLAATQKWIDRLKALGCLFALDDFGVGFSSFTYLQALPVDYIKIDRSFVQDVETNATNRAVVEAVNAVARTLGKGVIAEGVECEAHKVILREIGIEHAQGFLWGEPQIAAGIPDLIRSPRPLPRVVPPSPPLVS